MSYSAADTSDLEKLQLAFTEITSKFGSIESILEAFGLADMPIAQRYGVLFGCLVFACTVISVFALLVFGGSFERMAEQASTGEATVLTDYKARKERPMLLERLLDARQRLLDQNYPDRKQRKNQRTKLTTMLMNLRPPVGVPDIVDDNEAKAAVNKKEQRPDEMSGYKENFVTAYRKCQDKPGGTMLSGKPEARFEAYARAYASCGDETNLSYRRSYARLYETLCCDSHADEERYSLLYKNRPEDMIGKYCRLEALDVKRHLKGLYAATCGDVCFYKNSYDPDEVWGFLNEGPFASPAEMEKSFVFQNYDNEAGFAIVQSVTDRLIGVVLLSNDSPENLSIQLNSPILGPSLFGGKEQLESCFLLLDRLFAHGYRRVQLSLDAKDMQGSKIANRLGFTLEGCLLKHMVVKESSRDSNIYGMLNSDWDKGARQSLYSKLYGIGMARADVAFNQKEEELDHQNRVLAEKKRLEEAKNEKKKN